MKKTAKIQVKKMSPNLARIQAGIQLNKKSPNLAKILVILLNLSLKLSLKSAKMQRNHPNFRILNRKSGPSPIWLRSLPILTENLACQGKKDRQDVKKLRHCAKNCNLFISINLEN